MPNFFSVIIPVYNDADDLKLVLEALENQKYPEEQFEVIVVDNGSTDTTCKVARSYGSVTLLKEQKHLNSPYSARNRGIEQSTGSIIVLLDATCVPQNNWLKMAEKSLVTLDCDLLGGNVDFRFKNKKPTTAEYYDSITNIQMKESIEARKVAKTANLFVKKTVFEDVGLFPEGVRSGGDVRWTKKAVEKGFNLAYSHEAKVFKKARTLKPLIKKQWRVSKGQPTIWMEQRPDINFLYFLRILIATILLKPFKSEIKERLAKADYVERNKWLRFKLEGLNYLIKVIMKFGNLYGYILSRT